MSRKMRWNIATESFACIVCLLAVLGLGCAENVPHDPKVAAPTLPTGGSPTIEDQNGTADSVYIRSRRAWPSLERRPCTAPRQPVNGEWKMRREFCRDTYEDCYILEGTELQPTTQLIYSCKPGYVTEGNTDVICQAWGTWTAIPVCKEIRCPTLTSISRTASCSRSRKSVSCDSPALPRTRAEISCRPGYKTDTTYTFAPGNILDCTEDGKWEPEPFRCIPVCGIIATRQAPFVTGGVVAKISDFPWQATLYTQETTSRGTKKIFRCGGTIIQANLIMTAAHCVYDEQRDNTMDAGRLFILAGNVHQDYDSPNHNYQLVRKGEVKNVYVYCTYYGLRGNYASDIALLELKKPLVLSQILLPACLDHSGYNDRFLETRPYGRVAGFGRTETQVTSEILRTVSVPYIPYNECRSSKHASDNQEFITLDKFCAGYSNGSGVSDGDSGGGLVFQRNELWYVMGIVSVGLGVSVEDGERKADRFSYSLYTKVSTYIDWIHEVIYNLEKFNGHRACRTDSHSSDTPTEMLPPSNSKPLNTLPNGERGGTCRVECGPNAAANRKYPRENLPQGYVAYPDIGFAYKVHNLLVTWPQAFSRCLEEGAQLALIDSMKKVEYVRSQKTRRNWAWSGILRMYDKQKWVAVRTGLPVETLPWKVESKFPWGTGDCVLAEFDKWGVGLGNHPCVDEHNFVCELPIF